MYFHEIYLFQNSPLQSLPRRPPSKAKGPQEDAQITKPLEGPNSD